MPDGWNEFQSGWLIPAGLLLLILSQFLLHFLKKPIIKKKPKLPGNGWSLVYTDNAPKNTRTEGVIYGKTLRDLETNLTGKPDMIYYNGKNYIPVELKSGSIGEKLFPREGDLMQLTVYFFLIKAEYGSFPREGRLVYSDGMFVARNTSRLRGKLLSVLDEMRRALENPDSMAAAEYDFVKCKSCPCRGTVCGLAD